MENEREKKVKSGGDVETVRIDFHIPDNFPTIFATEMVTQSMLTTFILSFFEIKLPLGLTPETEVKDSVRAECVARLAISADKIPDIIKALKEHFAKFLEQRKVLTEAAASIKTNESSKK